MASETVLNAQAIIGLFALIFGLFGVCLWTIPSTLRDVRSYDKGTPERTLFEWDMRLALVSLAKLVLLTGVVVVILVTEPSMLRSALTRPMLLATLCLVAFTSVLTPLRRRAIERTTRASRGAERGAQRPDRRR